jgi:hypothetical protein
MISRITQAFLDNKQRRQFPAWYFGTVLKALGSIDLPWVRETILSPEFFTIQRLT